MWSNAGNWWRAQYHSTIRLAGPPPVRMVPDPDAGVMPAVDGGGTPDEDGGGTPRRDSGSAGGEDAGEPDRMVAEGGCGCRVPDANGGSWLAWLLVLGLVLSRRR